MNDDRPNDFDFEVIHCEANGFTQCPQEVEVYPLIVNGEKCYYAGLVNHEGWTRDADGIVCCPDCNERIKRGG